MKVLLSVATLLPTFPLLYTALAQQSLDNQSLRLRNGKFRIAIFSDLHFGENEDSFGIPQDINSTILMNFVLDIEKPDLAILNGDLITGENTFAFNSSKYVDKIVAPLVARGIPWASTYGNHDSKYNLSREDIYTEEKKYSLSLTRQGPPNTDGVTNYNLGVYPSEPQAMSSAKPVALLHFFDSRGGCQGEPDNIDNIPNWVSVRTTRWFHDGVAQAAEEWGVVPSFAFVHIPMRAFYDLQNRASANVSGSRYPGMNADIPLGQQGNGEESKPFMQALLDTPGLHSVYSGHDHGDSWCGRWPDETLPGQTASRPFLCFCKHSGFGGYGTWNRGVRILEFSPDTHGNLNVRTWVRMQQGPKVTAVSLNDTYGQDIYPTEDGGYHPY